MAAKEKTCILVPVRMMNDLLRALTPFADQAAIIDRNDESEGRKGETFELFKFRGSYAALCLGDCRRAQQALIEAQKAISP